MAAVRRKLVTVGDIACGKTCLLMTFSIGYFQEDFVPTTFEHFVADIKIEGKHVELALWDTADHEYYNRIRPLVYPNSHVLLICFAINSPDSLESITEKWVSEVQQYCNDVPILLVGCKMDLRDDQPTIEALRRNNQAPVSPEQGGGGARYINAHDYLECSAKTGEGVLEVFKIATRASLLAKPKGHRRPKCLVL
jgi:Ras family protein A